VESLQEAICAGVANVLLHGSGHADVEVTESDAVGSEVLFPIL